MLQETKLPFSSKPNYKLVAQTDFCLQTKKDIHRIYFGPKSLRYINQNSKIIVIPCGLDGPEYNHKHFVDDCIKNIKIIRNLVLDEAI